MPCPLLKESSPGSEESIVYCSKYNFPLYRKCCPPENPERFFICIEEFDDCEGNLEKNLK